MPPPPLFLCYHCPARFYRSRDAYLHARMFLHRLKVPVKELLIDDPFPVEVSHAPMDLKGKENKQSL